MTPDGTYPVLTGTGADRLRASSDRVIVVGAGGWLGMATLEALRQTLGPAFHDRVLSFGSNRRILRLRGGVEVTQAPLTEIVTLRRAPTLVFHLAYLTQEKAKTMSETDYVAANRAISAHVLSALDPIGATGVFVASSGAVYMVDDEGAEASKRLYGRLKLEDERAYSRWAEQAGRRTAVARIFNVAGPYVTTGGAYALVAFIADALAKHPIEIKARRRVWRSYVAIDELMSVALGLLTDEGSGTTTFDTAGLETREMNDIARAVTAAIAPGLTINRAPMENAPEDRYVGNGAAYQALRHRFDVEAVDFAAQVRQTAAFMAHGAGSR